MITASEIKTPRFIENDNGAIELLVRFEGEHGWSPFVARPTDQYGRGAEIFQRAIDGEFGPITPYVEPEPDPEPAPQSVTMRQARLALLQAGLLAQVDTAIDQLPEPDKTAARIEWEYSQEVQRDKPFVQMLAPALGLTEQDLDALFVQAATL